MSEEQEYEALLIDTSIFDGNGLRLEKGLLGKLNQFKRSPVVFLLPDVIPTLTWKSEVKDDDGKPKWMIGRYEPVYDADGVSRSCRVVFRGALITANGPRRQTNESRRLWDEDERYYGYWT